MIDVRSCASVVLSGDSVYRSIQHTELAFSERALRISAHSALCPPSEFQAMKSRDVQRCASLSMGAQKQFGFLIALGA